MDPARLLCLWDFPGKDTGVGYHSLLQGIFSTQGSPAWGFPDGSDSKESTCNAEETQVQSLGQEDPVQKGMATHSSILAWEIPWTEESGRLQFTWMQKSQTGLSDSAITTIAFY